MSIVLSAFHFYFVVILIIFLFGYILGKFSNIKLFILIFLILGGAIFWGSAYVAVTDCYLDCSAERIRLAAAKITGFTLLFVLIGYFIGKKLRKVKKSK